MNFRVVLLPLAISDLDGISNWVASRADNLVAERYDARIRAKVATLAYFPSRDTPHEDLRPNLRSITIERRFMILYEVVGSEVWIRRIFGAARDLHQIDL